MSQSSSRSIWDKLYSVRSFWLTVVCVVLAVLVHGQNKVTLSGYVKDKESGETMIGVSVVVSGQHPEATVTNNYGFYSLTLDKGAYVIHFSYTGYENQSVDVHLDKNTMQHVFMSEGIVMQEVVVSAEREERRKNVESTQMGTIEVPVEAMCA